MRAIRLVVLLAALSLLVAGCGESTPTPAVAELSTTEPPPPPTAAPAEGGPCDNEFLPVVKGATWTYEGTTSDGAYSEYAVILEAEGDRFELGVSLADVSYQEAWQCTEEGLVQLEDPTSPFTALFAGPDAAVSVATIDTEGVTLPKTFDVGDEWDQTTQLQINSDAYAGPSTLTNEFSAVRSEQVTVAGTAWQAIVVEVSSRMEVRSSPQFAIEYESRQWFVPGVGLVKFEGEVGTWEVNGQPVEPSSDFDVSYELVGYSVP